VPAIGGIAGREDWFRAAPVKSVIAANVKGVVAHRKKDETQARRNNRAVDETKTLD